MKKNRATCEQASQMYMRLGKLFVNGFLSIGIGICPMSMYNYLRNIKTI